MRTHLAGIAVMMMVAVVMMMVPMLVSRVSGTMGVGVRWR
jgi:hypothetical protein